MVLDVGVRAGSVAVLRALAIAVGSAVLSANFLSGRDDRALVAPIGVATVGWTASSLCRVWTVASLFVVTFVAAGQFSCVDR
jgi:hypothetical protein